MRGVTQAHATIETRATLMRKATPQDAAQIAEWFMYYFIENQTLMPMKVKVDYAMVRDFMEKSLKNPDLISFIADDGVIMGEIAQTWWGHNKIGNGGIWYVKPEARNGILARALLRAFDEEATARGAVYSRMSLDNPAHFKTVDGLYHLSGYRDYSKIYVKDLK